ncbi:hypothetical protein [Zhenpiania hominis]|uniref:Uncharacterized protein n=1 Tax=Zhenpiania hominis TaxID=2763644 RepID=A0A923NFZ3_9FIRM|nr:hypothetical protein [Zhenpiania hominis]MBC6678256.1 hypothetical protein [Zhenpiania hominis]
MVKFEFYISDDKFEQLYMQKDAEGKEGWTGNEFARELLLRQLAKYKVKRTERSGDKVVKRKG